jgi:hypothetical protein
MAGKNKKINYFFIKSQKKQKNKLFPEKQAGKYA